MLLLTASLTASWLCPNPVCPDCVAVAAEAVESLIIAMVRRRTKDGKVGVRKAALLALEAIIRLDMNSIRKDVRCTCLKFVTVFKFT